MKKFVAEPSFWELFPQAAIGVAVVEGLSAASQLSPEAEAEVSQLLERANRLAERHLTSSTISQNAPVAAWRSAYQKFKTKRGAHCSVENLLKRVLKDNPVGHITPSVDIYNAVSLKYALPVGGEDLDAIQGNMRLSVTQGGDAFQPLGEDEDPTLPGELCYLDDAGAVCRCWNWRDGARTALTDTSLCAVFFIECVEPERIEDMRLAINELAELLHRHLGCTVRTCTVVDAAHPEVVLCD